MQCYVSATQINPEYSPAWYNIGVTLSECGRYVCSEISAIERESEYCLFLYSNRNIVIKQFRSTIRLRVMNEKHIYRSDDALEAYKTALLYNPRYVNLCAEWGNDFISYLSVIRCGELTHMSCTFFPVCAYVIRHPEAACNIGVIMKNAGKVLLPFVHLLFFYVFLLFSFYYLLCYYRYCYDYDYNGYKCKLMMVYIVWWFD